MNTICFVTTILIIVLALFYLLWINGYLTIYSKAAVLYLGRRGKDYSGAIVDYCSGYAKRVIKFKHDGMYQFNLDMECKKGEMFVTLQDKHKNDIAVFDKNMMEKSLNLKSGETYYLNFNYTKASGHIKLSWKQLD